VRARSQPAAPPRATALRVAGWTRLEQTVPEPKPPELEAAAAAPSVATGLTPVRTQTLEVSQTRQSRATRAARRAAPASMYARRGGPRRAWSQAQA